jgi:hypothetical protein
MGATEEQEGLLEQVSDQQSQTRGSLPALKVTHCSRTPNRVFQRMACMKEWTGDAREEAIDFR